MQGYLAERPLLGWPGIVMRISVKGGRFTVTCTHDETGVTKFLYEGLNFGDAADAYKHPFVKYHDEVTELTDTIMVPA